MDEAAEYLMQGGVGILPTDTLYGLVGSALDPDAVERIYDLKERQPDKPVIVLISQLEQLEQFGVVMSEQLKERLLSYWPGPYTILLSIEDEQFEYLDRGRMAIAFRMPASDELRALIDVVGPIIAPSANTEGRPPARNVAAAKAYFGTDVDFYIEGEDLDGPPSTIIEFDGEAVNTLRG